MKRLLKVFIVFMLGATLYAAGGIKESQRIVLEKDLTSKNITVTQNLYKVLEFKKTISNIRVSNSNIEIDFIPKTKLPLSTVKVLGKNFGNSSAYIIFSDGKYMQLNINVVSNFSSVIGLLKSMYKNLEIYQLNDNIVLKGFVESKMEQTKILDILKKANIDIDTKVVNLLKINNPDKLVRAKLYVTEINNDKGESFKANWVAGINDGSTSASVTTDMLNAVSLTGGITAVASRLGSKFNTQFTLNYLKSNGLARILDETTLLTQENKDAVFNAGGTVYIVTQSTTSEGLPTSTLTPLDYGLRLTIKVNEILNGKYIDFDATTSSDTLDWVNAVNGMPALKGNEVTTSVIVENGSTVVLGGFIKSTNSENSEKVPFLSDIPILGKLFQSEDFQEGKSELVFFITLEIVDPKNNSQEGDLKSTKTDFYTIENR